MYQRFLSKKGFKYFIRYERKYKKNYKKLFHCLQLSKLTAYRRDFDKTKYTRFLIKDNDLPGKYNKIWDKVSNVI